MLISIYGDETGCVPINEAEILVHLSRCHVKSSKSTISLSGAASATATVVVASNLWEPSGGTTPERILRPGLGPK